MMLHMCEYLSAPTPTLPEAALLWTARLSLTGLYPEQLLSRRHSVERFAVPILKPLIISFALGLENYVAAWWR